MKNSIRSIEQAGIGKRVIALIMDAVIFAFTWMALALFVFTPIANKGFGYEDLGVQGTKYEVFSKLYVCVETNEDETTKVIDVNKFEESSGGNFSIIPLYNYESEDIEFYKDRLHYYYCCYKTGENIEMPEGSNVSDYRAPDFEELIDGKTKKEFYNEEWFANLIDGKTSIDDIKNLSYDAVKDMWDSSYFKEITTKMSRIQIFISIPPFVLSFGIFYILVPLLFKNGETFAKKFFKIGFVSKDGFDVKKRQIVFRQLIIFVWVSVSTFVIGIGLTSIATLGVGVLIYLVATLISKQNKSPADYAAMTYLIDTNKSVWFHDQDEEETKEKEFEENMAKYRKVEEVNKNVIQIGSEIVDEDLKREFEEKSKNNK